MNKEIEIKDTHKIVFIQFNNGLTIWSVNIFQLGDFAKAFLRYEGEDCSDKGFDEYLKEAGVTDYFPLNSEAFIELEETFLSENDWEYKENLLDTKDFLSPKEIK